MHRHRKGGSLPLGINGDVLRRHGLVEIIGRFTCRISIPTGENVTFFAFGHSGRLIVSSVSDGDLEFVGDGVLIIIALSAGVHIHNVVAVAGIVEFGIIISVFTGPSSIGLKCFEIEASDRILVFFSDSIAFAGAGIFVVQFIAYAIICLV